MVCWFRADLRVRDHPALCAAAARGRVTPLFVRRRSAAAGRDAVLFCSVESAGGIHYIV